MFSLRVAWVGKAGVGLRYSLYRIKAYSIEKKKRKNGGNIGFEVDKVTLKLPYNPLLQYPTTPYFITLQRSKFNAIW